jgi:hypothetical protein
MKDNEHFDPKPEKSQKSFFDRVKDMFSWIFPKFLLNKIYLKIIFFLSLIFNVQS